MSRKPSWLLGNDASGGSANLDHFPTMRKQAILSSDTLIIESV